MECPARDRVGRFARSCDLQVGDAFTGGMKDRVAVATAAPMFAQDVLTDRICPASDPGRRSGGVEMPLAAERSTADGARDDHRGVSSQLAGGVALRRRDQMDHRLSSLRDDHLRDEAAVTGVVVTLEAQQAGRTFADKLFRLCQLRL